jgi:hypothetical protein
MTDGDEKKVGCCEQSDKASSSYTYGISLLAERLSAFEEALCFMELAGLSQRLRLELKLLVFLTLALDGEWAGSRSGQHNH